jgi:hypothetical protein
MSIKKQRYASLCTKRREGVFRLRLKRYKFRPHQSNSHMDGKVKIYYKVWTNLQSNVWFQNYNIFYKDTSNISKPCSAASVISEKSFGLLTFGIVILHTATQYKVKSNYKRASNRYKYHTSLRWLRASSPAKFRPPFVQICVINLFPILRDRLGISTRSARDILKFGLFTIFPCVQPAFIKATAVPREASRAQKSPCPAITSLSASTLLSICSKVLGKSSTEGSIFLELAPTELKTCLSRCTQRLPKFKQIFWSSFKDFYRFEFFSTSASSLASKFFLSCSKLSDLQRSSLFNLATSVWASANEPSIV